MKKPVSAYIDTDELRQLIVNAKRLGRPEIIDEAFRRICELEGRRYDDPLERDFYAGLAAYEEILREKHGRKQPAARTRKKLKNKTFIQCMEDWGRATAPTEGFRILVDKEMPELTAEYLLCQYASRFTPKAVQRAKDRLIKFGVTPPAEKLGASAT
jgi:hypothetical protein